MSTCVLKVASPDVVQTFARELGPDDELEARTAGYPSAVAPYVALAASSRDKWALVQLGDVEHVVALAGVTQSGSFWVHTAAAFKGAGLSAMRKVRIVVGWLLEKYGELRIDVDVEKPELVRMADWLGFRLCGPDVEKFGRTYHQCRLRRAT